MKEKARITLLQAAKNVLNKNWTGSFTKPAPQLYPYQWNWDSGFIAIGYGHYAPERAFRELRSLFSAQWSNGMLPHINFGDHIDPSSTYFPGPEYWKTSGKNIEGLYTSGITQPAVHGFVLLEIYRNAKQHPECLPFLKEMFPKVLALHEYFYRFRNAGDGLIYIIHPWEPGTDNSPVWDQTMKLIQPDEEILPDYQRKDTQLISQDERPTKEDYDRYLYLVELYRNQAYDEGWIRDNSPFRIIDPLFNAILCKSNLAMIEIANVLGYDSTQFTQWFEETRIGMNSILWNEDIGIYQAMDLDAERKIEAYSMSGLLPIFGKIPSGNQVDRLLSTYRKEFIRDGVFRSCPAYPPTRQEFSPVKYWRGPIWINMNWMLWRGFRDYGMDQIANDICRQTLQLITEHGFFEYFEPKGEDGYGTSQFSWSAALTIDFLLSCK
jgi:hypothetical protein